MSMNGVKTLTIIIVIMLHIYVVCCKPLQQNSNDRTDYDQQRQTSINDDDNTENFGGADDSATLLMNENDENDDDSSIVSVSSSSALDTLKKATEAVNEFRRMLNERLLITTNGDNDKTSENFKYSGALPSRYSSLSSTNLHSTTLNDDIASSSNKRSEHAHHSRRKHRHKSQRKQQQQQQQQQIQLYQRDKEPADTVSDSASFGSSNNDDDTTIRDSLAQAFKIKINANLYRSPDENEQTLKATGRETEARFNLATGLFASPLECPRMHGKVTQLLCPSRRRHGYHVCIDETALCNGKSECPNGEDEDSVNCMFYKTTMRYFKTVVDQVVQLSDHILHSRRHANEEL